MPEDSPDSPDPWEQLVEDTHREVQKMRKARGLPPYPFMSNKKRRKRTLRNPDRTGLVKLVRAAARNNLGSPRPVTIYSNRTGTDKTVDDTDLGHFLHIREDRETTPNYVLSTHARPYVPTAKRATNNVERVRHGEVTRYSTETVAHANFLFDSEGEQAMTDYLNGRKTEAVTPDTAQTAPAPGWEDSMTRATPIPTPSTPGVPGIEATLADALGKKKFYEQQARRSLAEAEKWNGVASRLQAALDILSGKVRLDIPTQPGSDTGPVFKPGQVNWNAGWPELLKSGPLTPAVLQTAIVEKFRLKKTSAYQVMSKALRAGVLVRVGDKIALRSGAEPQNVVE